MNVADALVSRQFSDGELIIRQVWYSLHVITVSAESCLAVLISSLPHWFSISADLKVLIKILQGSEVTQTVLGGLTIFYLQISYSVYVPKIMKVGWQYTQPSIHPG